MQYIRAEAGSNKELFLSVAQKLWGAGVPVVDDVMAQRSHSENYADRKADLIKRLREMKPGVTEIIFHCSMKTDGASANSSPGPDMGLEGEMDVRLLSDPDIKAFIKNEGIVLTNWRELMKRREQFKN